TIFFNGVSEWLGLALYLGLGWIGIASGVLLCCRFGFRFVLPLLWGALAYTLRAVLEFLRLPLLVPGVGHAHELFHVAVLTGIFCHWRFVMQFADGTGASWGVKCGDFHAGAQTKRRGDAALSPFSLPLGGGERRVRG